jgi:hypothetical protein
MACWGRGLLTTRRKAFFTRRLIIEHELCEECDGSGSIDEVIVIGKAT